MAKPKNPLLKEANKQERPAAWLSMALMTANQNKGTSRAFVPSIKPLRPNEFAPIFELGSESSSLIMDTIHDVLKSRAANK